MKPELLLPVSNVENFFAACEGGADAVYLGLKKFNARGKAVNFTTRQLQSLLKEAEKRSVKVYLTLNTLIKNSEISDLLDTLHIISQSNVSAVIIQDWGVYYLIQKFFKNINIHASTQMANHNSLGAKFSSEKKFERVILARELTWEELTSIKKKSQIELELFIHGALCYSFSGMCMFSSFNGGMSANRGLCTQPCRRLYSSPEKKNNYFFSLKDLQLIDLIPKLSDLKISSLKIEGRMKSPEYVFQTASAYRIALDQPDKLDEAKEMLRYDFGREKTGYFISKNTAGAITENPFIGIPIGSVSKINDNGFEFITELQLKRMNRVRVLSSDGSNATAIKLKQMSVDNVEVEVVEADTRVNIITDQIQPKKGDKVFLLSNVNRKFSNKFSRDGKRLEQKLPDNKKRNILNRIGSKKSPKYQQIIFRINYLKWLNKLQFGDFDKLIIDLSRQEWEQFDIRKNFIKQNRDKFIIQLPKFIPEDFIGYYKDLVRYLSRNGFYQFMVNHVSQKILFSDFRNVSLYTSENVYSLNDPAIQFLKEEDFKSWIYPFENDLQNLSSGKDRRGIVPMFFLPQLFHSRMPVQLSSNEEIRDEYGQYVKHVKDGLTIIVPEKPAAILQHYSKLVNLGFRRFLIDLSFVNPSQHTFKRLLKNLYGSQKEKNSVIFNFKDGLK